MSVCYSANGLRFGGEDAHITVEGIKSLDTSTRATVAVSVFFATLSNGANTAASRSGVKQVSLDMQGLYDSGLGVIDLAAATTTRWSKVLGVNGLSIDVRGRYTADLKAKQSSLLLCGAVVPGGSGAPASLGSVAAPALTLASCVSAVPEAKIRFLASFSSTCSRASVCSLR